MGITFLAPLFLVALGALAVPVLVHLTHRERRDAIVFPSLMFLRRVPFRTVKRQRIRHWLLFALRVAAILLAVAAFSRPLIEGAGFPIGSLGAAREVVIALDRSYSMAYRDRWSRALAAVREEVERLAPDDRATIVGFADRVQVLNQATGDKALLTGLIGELQLTSGRTRYEPVLELARDILDGSSMPRRELVLITDFQRSGWATRQPVHMPAGTSVRAIDLSDADPENAAVSGVLLERLDSGGARRVRVAARLVNYGSTAVSDVPVSLELGRQLKETQRATVPARSAVVVRFAPVSVPNSPVRGRVTMPGDLLPSDDEFRFVLHPESPLRVLVLHHPRAGTEELLYLEQALAIGRSPPVAAEFKAAARIASQDLEGVDAVLLLDGAVAEGVGSRLLWRFVSEGGGLAVVLGPRSVARELAIGGTVGPVVDRLSDRGAALSILDYRHAVFEPFSQPGSGDFSNVRFFRYRRYQASERAIALARFDDGTPALAEEPFGAGRVLVVASGVSNLWNDLPVQPVFLPFVHQVVRYLADYRERPAWLSVGEVWGLSDLDELGWGATEVVVVPPRGERMVESLDEGRRIELMEAGFYEIRPLGGDDDRELVLAVNADRVESDLAPVNTDEFLAAVMPTGDGGGRAPTMAAALTPQERERRQGLWRFLLLALLLTLVAESAVAYGFSRPVVAFTKARSPT